jgi:hypothetical protein
MNTDQKNEKDLSVKIREIRGQGFAREKAHRKHKGSGGEIGYPERWISGSMKESHYFRVTVGEGRKWECAKADREIADGRGSIRGSAIWRTRAAQNILRRSSGETEN